MGKEKKEEKKISKRQQRRLGGAFSSLFQNEVLTCNCHCCRKIWYFYIWVLIIILALIVQWLIQFSQIQSLQKAESTELNSPTSQTLTPQTPQLVNVQKNSNSTIVTNSKTLTEISAQSIESSQPVEILAEEPSAPPIPPSVN